MLSSLHVRHFAVVEAAEIAFGPGLTVVSGETGAGKSLLVDALLLLTGQRADSGVVRAGSSRAELAAEFDLHALPQARAWLREEALDEDDACQLRRVIAAEGGSRAWINGRPVSAAQLAALGSLLIEVHGQHEHQALLQRTHQLTLLDGYAGHAESLAELAHLAAEDRAIARRMAEFGGRENREQRLQLLRHEAEALERWALDAEALAELEASHRRLAHAGQLAAGSAALCEQLDGEAEFSLNRLLHRAQAELERLAQLDPALQTSLELLESARIQLDELHDGLVRYVSSIELDSGQLSQTEERLSQLHELARRYRLPLTELDGKRQAAQNELAALENAGETLVQWERERSELAKTYQYLAAKISANRQTAAQRLGEEVSALMAGLGMAGGRMAIALNPSTHDGLDPQGLERCEFQVSANPGQPLRALRKVASGGELARISLAIEVATMDQQTHRSMVFDEVDSGIGGGVAEVVGQRLRGLGSQRQVLCVTHLPQVAAQGHAHLHVAKRAAGAATHTEIILLDAAGRSEELARMLGGVELTRETHAHAQQMLNRAQKDS